MLILIDGTGVLDDDRYRTDMRRSFCNQVRNQVGGLYYRGPTLLGVETSDIADMVVRSYLSSGEDDLTLVGYSRGACTAIIVAARLRAMSLTVRNLFLFDAVDMQLADSAVYRTISDNVEYVAHVRSARSLGLFLHHPWRARQYFYNTGLSLAGPGVMDTTAFTGTHGALGGCPWLDIDGDTHCTSLVAGWMTPLMRAKGLQVTLSLVQ